MLYLWEEDLWHFERRGGLWGMFSKVKRNAGLEMKLLVCGTRGYTKGITGALDTYYAEHLAANGNANPLEIIEGCCPDSADVIAEKFAKDNGLKIHHYPASSGTYLKRNVEMVNACDKALCFWNGYSYGSAHAIAQAEMAGKPVKIVKVMK